MRAVLALFAAVSMASVAQAGPVFLPLGDLGGGGFDSAGWGVSANGRYVVGDGDTATGPTGFRYEIASAQMVPLDHRPKSDPTDLLEGRARAISNDGNTIGGWVSRVGLGGSGDTFVDGAIWDASGNLTMYSADTSFRRGGGIVDLTPDGAIGAGWSANPEDPFEFPQPEGITTFAAYWTAAGGIDPRAEASFLDARAWSISSDGTVIAGSREQDFTFPHTAVRYSDADGFTDLGSLFNSAPPNQNVPFFMPTRANQHNIQSEARGISPDGSQLVGWTTSPGGIDAFLWEDDGNGMLALGDLSPGEDVASSAYAISSTGIVVGTADRGTVASDRIFEAFIYDEENGMVSLEDWLLALGIDFGGYELIAAYDISPSGQYIVGEAINPQGQSEAFFVNLPEPSSGSLLAMGLLGLLRARGRGRREPVRSHNRSAPESLSIPLLRAIDQRRKVARILT